MARFSGKIGYGESQEDPAESGIWVDQIIEKGNYFGDVRRDTRKLDKTDKLNDNLSVGNLISIVADGYALEHIMDIRYIWWMGKPWTVDSVEVQPPRLILSLGVIYNGPLPTEDI